MEGAQSRVIALFHQEEPAQASITTMYWSYQSGRRPQEDPGYTLLPLETWTWISEYDDFSLHFIEMWKCTKLSCCPNQTDAVGMTKGGSN